MGNSRSANRKSEKVQPVNWLRPKPEAPDKPAPEPVPFATAEGDSLADLATAQMAAVAPLPVAAALGLQPGATYRECFVQRLLLSAIQQGDTSAAKELLDRIDGKAATAVSAAEKRDAIITVRYDRNLLEQKLLGPIALGKNFENAIALRLEGENDAVALTAWSAMPPALREELWMELRDGLRSLMAEVGDDVQKTIQ